MTSDTINDALTAAPNAEGTLLAGRYRIVRQLGQGGMGSVWLAEDTQLDDKPFAIKMLPSILVANKRAYRQLKDEALVAMRLVHPNIVQIRAFEENDGNPFLVMDYVDGQTLEDYLAEHALGEAASRRFNSAPLGEAASRRFTGTTGVPPVAHGLPEADVLRILRPIAVALDYAHAKGVVHRDVKPGNVMIAKDGTPYILDFGIAREIQETLTRVTGKLSSGTLLYMSPEQLHGASPKPAQDIYSFAAMVYECLKGEPPFVRGQIEYQILNNPPPPLVGRGVLDAPLAASVMAGLAKKPEDRPASCTAVLEGRVPNAPLGGVRLSRPTERKPGGVWKILFAAVLLALMGVGVGAWYHLQELKHEREVAEKKAEEKRRKDEMLARQKESANEKKDKAEKLLAELRKDGAQDYGGESFRNIVALHAAGTNAFSRGVYVDASTQFDKMIKGAPECEQAIEQAKQQEREKREKENAKEMKGKAESAKKNAEDVNAKIYAERSWNNAIRSLTEANDKFVNGNFPAASNAFAIAVRQFEICTNEVAAVLKVKEAVIPIHDQALERQGLLKNVSGDEDIEASKNDLANTFAQADTLFSDKERRWSEAAVLFTNYVNQADVLKQMYNERQQTADAARSKAEAAKERAAKADAEQYAKESWKAAVERMKSANGKFENKCFASASNMFISAAAQFNQCAYEAKTNKAVRAWLGTWECSMQNVSWSSSEQWGRHLLNNVKWVEQYDFKEDGTYTCRRESTVYSDEEATKIAYDPTIHKTKGEWGIQGNVLTLCPQLGDYYADKWAQPKTDQLSHVERFTVTWLTEDSVELRHVKSREMFTAFGTTQNHSHTYEADGTCRTHIRVNANDLSYEVEQTETPHILRRK